MASAAVEGVWRHAGDRQLPPVPAMSGIGSDELVRVPSVLVSLMLPVSSARSAPAASAS